MTNNYFCLTKLGFLTQNLQDSITYLFISTSKARDDVDLFIREFKQLYDDDHNDDLKKNNRFNDQNNSSARASRFLVLTHFLDFHCTTTTLNLLISRFM